MHHREHPTDSQTTAARNELTPHNPFLPALIFCEQRYTACLRLAYSHKPHEHAPCPCHEPLPAQHLRFQVTPCRTSQVADLEQSKAAVEQDMASLAARIAAAQSFHRGRTSAKSGSAGAAAGRAGRKSGRVAAAAAAAYPPVMPVAPLPIAPPVIPAHFVPYTFKYPGREPFTVCSHALSHSPASRMPSRPNAFQHDHRAPSAD